MQPICIYKLVSVLSSLLYSLNIVSKWLPDRLLQLCPGILGSYIYKLLLACIGYLPHLFALSLPCVVYFLFFAWKLDLML